MINKVYSKSLSTIFCSAIDLYLLFRGGNERNYLKLTGVIIDKLIEQTKYLNYTNSEVPNLNTGDSNGFQTSERPLI